MISTVFSSAFSPTKRSTPAPETLPSALGSLFGISNVFCAMPPLLGHGQPNGRLRFWLQCAYQFVFFATITVCMVAQYLHFDAAKQRLAKFLYTVSYFMSAGNNAIILAGSLTLHQFYATYVSELLAIDGRLSAIDGRYANALGYAPLRRFVAGWLTVVAAVLGSSMVIDACFNEGSPVAFVRSWMVYLVPNMTICLIVLQFMAVLRALSGKYEAINDIVERMFLRGNGAQKTLVTTVQRKHPHLLASRSEAALNSLRSIHFRLNRLNESATTTFGRVLCSVFVWTVLVLTIQLYQLYAFAQHFEGWRDYWLMAYTLVWTLLYAGRLLALLVYSARLNVEKRKVIGLLFRTDLEGRVKMTRRMDQCINKFSLQMLHEQRFQTACGILQLDMTLVATLVSVLTSYLVILIQFDSSTRMANDAST